MEVAAGLASNGLPVTMVFPEDRILSRLLTPQLAAVYERLYDAKGVKMIKEARVTGFGGADGKVRPGPGSPRSRLPTVDRGPCSSTKLSEEGFDFHCMLITLYGKCLNCALDPALQWCFGCCSPQPSCSFRGLQVTSLEYTDASGAKHQLEAALIVVGVGARPNVELFDGELRMRGLSTHRSDGATPLSNSRCVANANRRLPGLGADAPRWR